MIYKMIFSSAMVKIQSTAQYIMHPIDVHPLHCWSYRWKKMLVLTRFPSIMAIEYVDNLDPVQINVKRGIWDFPAINSAHYKQND